MTMSNRPGGWRISPPLRSSREREELIQRNPDTEDLGAKVDLAQDVGLTLPRS